MQKRLLDLEGKGTKTDMDEEELLKEMTNLEEIAEVEDENAGSSSKGFH